MKLFIINGPNLNMLGIRQPEIYGKSTLKDLEKYVADHCDKLGFETEFYQSNCEGDIVTAIQNCYKRVDGIIINAGAYTHTSIAILDALKSVDIPAVEVHLSDVNAREDFRKISYLRLACFKTISGKHFDSYTEAVDALKEYLTK
ncbi:MAG: 3-dehydroquinate dehydratase [Oscillospiraceae bacterium]|nr:3-dehydroquinate dehydratase [Oscillospiraceae bacterium]